MNRVWKSTELLKWLNQATPSEMYGQALETAGVADAITICDHILISTKGKDPLEARARLLKARLFLKLEPSEVARSQTVFQLEMALRAAKNLIPDNDPEIIEAQQALSTLKPPPDPNWVLVNSHSDTLHTYCKNLHAEMGYQAAEEYILENLTTGWRVLKLTQQFDNHVMAEGMATYFANTQGWAGDHIIAAFKKLNRNLGSTVKKAFAIFEENEVKHAASLEARADQYTEFNVVPAHMAPGRYDGDNEDYDDVQDDYVGKAEGLTRMLADYIRAHPKEFLTLP